jgi:hypothetical protein
MGFAGKPRRRALCNLDVEHGCRPHGAERGVPGPGHRPPVGRKSPCPPTSARVSLPQGVARRICSGSRHERRSPCLVPPRAPHQRAPRLSLHDGWARNSNPVQQTTLLARLLPNSQAGSCAIFGEPLTPPFAHTATSPPSCGAMPHQPDPKGAHRCTTSAMRDVGDARGADAVAVEVGGRTLRGAVRKFEVKQSRAMQAQH